MINVNQNGLFKYNQIQFKEDNFRNLIDQDHTIIT